MNPVFLSDSVYLHFGTSNATSGAAANADSTPVVSIEEDGVVLGYAPTVTNVAVGLYRVQIDATAGNGFEVGRRYSVYVVATVATITGRDGLAEFEVLTTDLDTVSSRVDAAVTTRMATFTLPTNFSALSITAGGLVDITQAAADKVWSTAARTLTSFGTLVQDIWDKATSALTVAGSIGKLLVDNINATISSRMATFTLPTNFSALSITAAGLVDITQAAADKVWSTAARTLTSFGTLASDVWAVGTRTLTGFSTSLAVSVWDVLESAIATASSIGLKVKTNLDAAVSSRLATAGYTAPLDAAGTRAALGMAAANLDTQLSAINTKTTNLPTDPADESLIIAATDAIMTRLGVPAGASVSVDVAAVKSDTAAVKAKTDSLTFTVANKVDSNIKYVNDIAVTGTGVTPTPWGPV